MQHTRTLPLFLLSFFLAFTTNAQDAAGPRPGLYRFVPDPAQDRSLRDSLLRWEERIYLHTDRDQAAPGEVVFFKAYATTGPNHLRVSPSGVLKVELLDSEKALVSTQFYRLQAGTAQGTLQLPKKLEPDTYSIRAYTRWMENYGPDRYFEQPLHIGTASGSLPENPSPLQMASLVEVFPEGGGLLAGKENKLVVTARDALGCPVSFQARVVSLDGREAYPVETYAQGYGMVVLTPRAGAGYRLEMEQGGTHPLPPVTESGYSLRLNNLDPEVIRVEVQATEDLRNHPVRLSGMLGGQVYLERELAFDNSLEARLEISKKGIPQGLMELRITDEAGTVRASRPLALSAEPLRMEVEPLPGNEFRVRVTDASGQPVATDLSVAVTGQRAASRHPGLVASLPPGLGAGGQKAPRQRVFLQDLQALASRPGTVTDMPGEVIFPVQTGLELHVKVYDMSDQLLPNTHIQVLGSSGENLLIREARTDASGILHLKDLDITGETQLVFRTQGEETAERLVKVKPVEDLKTGNEKPRKVSNLYERAMRKNPVVTPTAYAPYDTTGLIRLRQATVKANNRKEEARKIAPSTYGVQPLEKNTIYQDPKRPQTMLNLVRRIPGMIIRNEGTGNPVVYNVRNLGYLRPGLPLWVLDGQILRSAPGAGYDAAYNTPIFDVPAIDIERIEYIIDPSQTGIFGIQGSNGVILVYTRTGGELRYLSRKEASLTFKGFEPPERFEDIKAAPAKEDRAPLTYYWNPELRTNARGEARFRLDEVPSGAVHIVVQGLTPDGRPGTFTATLEPME
ncbi:Plug domain-containing protein [Robiginitalea sp. M366]|uniref:TonB-dependent receptor n=1 Tax=Robiginitalea aestuariiviva TaxID=3036903 RepID=UPI00240E3957|nr:Plug domain-containing protein [Robiginitalea aestuariiviva]MDG1572643.1 Plug domain-containing protein [Robiginitalea aestuariiviva]